MSFRRTYILAVVAIALATASAVLAPSAGAVPSGPRDVVVILFNFTNNSSQPVAASQVKDWTFANANGANAWTKEDSGNLISLRGLASASGDVFGWYNIGVKNTDPSGGCVTSATLKSWRDLAKAKANAAGKSIAGAEHVVFLMPTVGNICGSTFMGIYVGGTNEIMLNGQASFDNYVNTFTHELSHALPPYNQHANSLKCKYGAEVVPIEVSGNCVSTEYGDYLSRLGHGPWKTLNDNVHRARLGYFPSANIVTASKATPAIYSLKPSSPVLTAGGGTQVLRIDRATTDNAAYRWMYLEYRQRWGTFDSTISPTSVDGIHVRLAKDLSLVANDVTPATSHLIDASPWSPWVDAAPSDTELELGEALYDPIGDFSIKLTSFNGTAALISVNPGLPSGSQGTVSVSGGVLRFAAATGKHNILAAARSGDSFVVMSPYPVGGQLTAGSGCVQMSQRTVVCPTAGVTSARFDLGDEEDAIRQMPDLPATINGGAGNDEIQGGSQNDQIDGGAGDDKLYGNGGTDRLIGQSGADTMVGGAGIDTLDYSYAFSTVRVYLTLGNASADGATDSISGFEDIIGGAGNDYLGGNSTVNVLDGGPGSDLLDGDADNDYLIGGPGGGGDNDDLGGGSGNDTARYSARTTPVYASINGLADDGAIGEGDNVNVNVEVIEGGSAADVLYGSELNDTLVGNGGADNLYGLGGNDWILARDGANDGAIDCGAGADTLLADLIPFELMPIGCETIGRS